MDNRWEVPYTPQPRQRLLHETTARQIFYGGALGGGKSHALRWDAIKFALENPGCQAYLFRRTLTELTGTHIQRIKQELPESLGIGRYAETRNTYEFKNGSGLHFCYCDKDDDVNRYLSEEMHWLGIDEAGQMTEHQLTRLVTRVRLGNWKPAKDDGRLPRIAMASNPGGPGHAFLKSTFIDPNPAGGEIFHDGRMRDPRNPEDMGWSTIFIPARMEDNSYLDAGYAASVGGLPPELQRAWRDGDWDAVVGKAVHNLDKERHMLRQFSPPKHWTKFMCIDWGTAAPFSVGWYAVSEGAILKGEREWPERYLPEGALVRYAEWYGWNKRPNQGCRMESGAVARRVIEMEKERGDLMDYRIGDSHMWAKGDGPSIAERMHQATGGYFTMRKSEKDRKHNYAELLARLAGSPTFRKDGKEEEHPMLFITANCHQFWRTVPILTSDENDPEKGPDSKLEDHVYDELCYACRSRPYVMTERDRFWEEYEEEILHARKQNLDPYATA